MKNHSDISINLESLIDLSAKLNQTADATFILNSALLSLMGKLRLTRACVLKPEPMHNKFSVFINKGRSLPDFLPLCDFSDKIHLNQSSNLNSCTDYLFKAGLALCLPVFNNDKLIAIICLGTSIDNKPFSQTELYYIDLVVTITANALINASNHNNLISAKNEVEQHNQLLTTLFELSRDFSSLLSKDEIIRMLSFHLMGQLMVSRFALYLYDNKKGNENFRQIINRFTDDTSAILPHASSIKNTININNLSQDSELYKLATALGLQLIVPMVVQSEPKGWLMIGKKMNGGNFSSENIQFIEALGSRAMSSLENERLFQEELEKEKLESELHLALDIQKNLLPKSIPSLQGFDFDGTSIPSRFVGGDYFDFIPLPNNRLLMAIADVSGKGMPASLLMANVQAALRALAPLDLSLVEICTRINKIVHQNTTPDKFVTFFCAILDPEANTLQYLNAGHNPPYLFRQSSLTQLDKGGLILGIFSDGVSYEQDSIFLDKNDCIVMYTDGITEALDIHNNEFSEQKLIDIVQRNINASAQDITKTIVSAVNSFSSGRNQFDDITLIVVKRNNE